MKDETNGEWRIRNNKELYNLFESPLITTIMKANRLRWVGHLERMEENRQTKAVYTEELTGKRPRGRPRQRWKDNIKEDLQNLEISNWQEMAKDRNEWRRVVSAAMILDGSES